MPTPARIGLSQKQYDKFSLKLHLHSVAFSTSRGGGRLCAAGGGAFSETHWWDMSSVCVACVVVGLGALDTDTIAIIFGFTRRSMRMRCGAEIPPSGRVHSIAWLTIDSNLICNGSWSVSQNKFSPIQDTLHTQEPETTGRQAEWAISCFIQEIAMNKLWSSTITGRDIIKMVYNFWGEKVISLDDEKVLYEASRNSFRRINIFQCTFKCGNFVYWIKFYAHDLPLNLRQLVQPFRWFFRFQFISALSRVRVLCFVVFDLNWMN